VIVRLDEGEDLEREMSELEVEIERELEERRKRLRGPYARLSSISSQAVFRIQQIHVYFGLPDPDPLVRGMDPDPALDPDPPDPRVFWPPGSGSTSQRYGSGSGSGSGSFYHHAKITRKTLNPTIL
jgi:hypothetical protein